MTDRNSRIAIAGAGSIGCYIGGCLALAGRDVAMLLRPVLAEPIRAHGLRISDLAGADHRVPPSAVKVATDAATALAGADLVLVTVKSGDTAGMAGLIAVHAPPAAVVVSLQNGVGNLDVLRAHLEPGRRLVAGMVPFNVVQTRPWGEAPRFHRATSGKTLIGAGAPGLRDVLDVPGMATAEHRDMPAVLWGKLLLNLNNALNALSGLPLAEQLADRRWRALLAAQIDEARGVLKAAGVRPASIEGVPPQLIPSILRLPDWLFRRAARRMLAIDPAARSSMWEDLAAHRRTEIDHLQGAVLALAAKHNLPAPLTERIARLVREAERAGAGSPALRADAISRVIG